MMISILMTVIAIFAAVYFHEKLELKGRIAVVTTNKTTVFKSDYFDFITMKERVPTSELVLGKYDGEIIEKRDGDFEVFTIKNQEFVTVLEEIVKEPNGYIPLIQKDRGIGTNIIGYLTLFILLQGLLSMFMLAEEIEQKQMERIAIAPVSFFSYLMAHFLFGFVTVFLPAFLILAILKGIGFTIGFSLWQYAFFLALLCMLGIAFSMFLLSLINISDTANMIGSSIIILTTILSGSFYAFEQGHRLFEKLIWILPQKNYLSVVQGLESDKAITTLLPQLSYYLFVLLFLFTFSVIKIKNDYVLRKD